MMDIRTPREKARDERSKRVCESFLRLSNEMPTVAPYRIFRIIAENTGITVPGVKGMLVRNGLYQVKPQREVNR